MRWWRDAPGPHKGYKRFHHLSSLKSNWLRVTWQFGEEKPPQWVPPVPTTPAVDEKPRPLSIFLDACMLLDETAKSRPPEPMWRMSYESQYSKLRHKGVLVSQSEKCLTLILSWKERTSCETFLFIDAEWGDKMDLDSFFLRSAGVHDAACYSSSSKALICDRKRKSPKLWLQKKSCNTAGMSLFSPFYFKIYIFLRSATSSD